jgi:uncharacterized protein YraI
MGCLFKVGGAMLAAAVALVLATQSGPGHADYVSGLNPRGDNFLSLRTGPGSKYREIRRLGPNTFLSVEARSGSWLKVRLRDGGTGWVFGKYVAPGAPPPPPSAASDSSIAVSPPPTGIEPQQPAAPPAALPAASGWTFYDNPRFGTRIAYPANLFAPLPPPENGDGLGFRSIDGAAKFIVFGQFNVLEKTVEEMLADDLASGQYEQVTYQRKAANWYVLSGYRQGNVFYRKVIVPAGTDILHAFEIDYPPRHKSVYDTITARMAKSLSAPTDTDIATGPSKVDEAKPVEAPPRPDRTPQPATGDLRSLLRAEFLALGGSIR